MTKAQTLYKKAKKIIPGGTQLLSKRPEFHLPDQWPTYYKKAQGCKITDIDGKNYTDVSFMGIGSCILGYADRDVNHAVKKAIDHANMTTLNCPEEVELAEYLCKTHKWADMARFARTGGEAVSISVRIARAYTKKDIILFCGYHGWHDWYLAANLSGKESLNGHLLTGLDPIGVPKNLKGTAIPFTYNDQKSFMGAIKKYKGRIAAVFMEPIRNYYPQKGFLKKIRQVTKELGIVLIFDEITSGWRLTNGGAHLHFNVNPDMAVFAKGISNGFPMAAIIGKRDIMQAAQVAFISSTYWTEKIGPVAALTTIRKMKKNKVVSHINRIGKLVQQKWQKSAKKYDLKINISGIYPLSHFSFDYKNPLELKTLFTQLMLEKKFLASTSFYVSYAHKDEIIKKYLRAVDQSFSFIADAINDGIVGKYLKGPVCHGGFKRLN